MSLWLHTLISRLRTLFLRPKTPARLPSAVLAQVAREADFLRGQGVQVRHVGSDEQPGLPTAATPDSPAPAQAE